ncbi:MAG: SCO family protein [Candidatus Thiodiazotropha sp. (ex Ctena orbiculata)]|nr:SCO family protein [Candidatus Thiodiazotropha taylori]
MQRPILIVVTLTLAAALVWMLLFWQPQDEKHATVPLQAIPQGGDFSFDSYRGEVSLKDFRGSVVLLYFGYTWCPDICPTNLSMISTILDEFPVAERARVQPIFISVDPARDSVQRLKEYVEYFHPSLLGLTGDESALTDVAEQYGAAYKIHAKQGDDNYVVDHTADTYLIDTHGKLAKILPHGTDLEALMAAVRELL